MHFKRALAFASLFASTLSCDRELPSGAVGENPPRALEGARDPGSSFSMLIPIPSTNEVSFGAQPWTTATDVEGPGVAEINVSGTISRTKTQYPGSYGCSPGPTIITYLSTEAGQLQSAC